MKSRENLNPLHGCGIGRHGRDFASQRPYSRATFAGACRDSRCNIPRLDMSSTLPIDSLEAAPARPSRTLDEEVFAERLALIERNVRMGVALGVAGIPF